MKKILGLSLVASATIFTLNASAQDLSSAIKNVDVSGTAWYRYNDYGDNNDNAGNSTNNFYKVAVNLNSKVNEDVTFGSRVVMDGSGGLDAINGSDIAVPVELVEANFAYSGINNATITAGKQAINTAFTVGTDSTDLDSTGTGLVASYNFEKVNVFGAFFNQTNFNEEQDGISGSEDVMALGINVAISNTTIDASYLNIQNIADAFTVGIEANLKLGEVSVSPFARYSSLDEEDDGDSTTSEDNSLFKLGVYANYDIFGAHLVYGATDKDGGDVGIDGSSATGLDEHWRVTLSGNEDASAIYAGVSAQVMPKLNIALNYSDMSVEGVDNDESEIYVQAAYKMSSNLSTYVRLGQYDNEANKDKQSDGRLNIQYSF